MVSYSSTKRLLWKSTTKNHHRPPKEIVQQETALLCLQKDFQFRSLWRLYSTTSIQSKQSHNQLSWMEVVLRKLFREHAHRTSFLSSILMRSSIKAYSWTWKCSRNWITTSQHSRSSLSCLPKKTCWRGTISIWKVSESYFNFKSISSYRWCIRGHIQTASSWSALQESQSADHYRFDYQSCS